MEQLRSGGHGGLKTQGNLCLLWIKDVVIFFRLPVAEVGE